MRVVHGARGFCNINIEAIMIEYLRRAYRIKKVAIVDTDCHHGDGTQDIYWHDPHTLFISIHQDGRTLYPGSGFLDEMGGPNAVGTTVNIPLPPNTSEDGFLYTMEHVVLPILADFSPELVVNSAGQDNHFSDPITNMNFSAQGYARLTEMLKPDIAVLEGGYSIEGALPYVNAGIILAMAGLDYSRVREPNYDPAKIRQSRDADLYIQRIGQMVLDQWQNNRSRINAPRQGTKERSRSIFYDTDNIHETQKETTRLCNTCGGVLRIESSCNLAAHRILAVHIPFLACDECRRTGAEWFAQADASRYDFVFLQDRPADRYIVKGRH
jgi:hypothetical protein